jgi:hypothetical protein
MKHIEEVPWWICDEEDTNYCAYSDTDSIYINAQPLLEHLNPNFNDLTEKERDDACEDVALKYQDIITDYYSELARDCFNVGEHRLEMKTEAVIRSAYFRATRRYAQWITKQEGIEKESLDIKGLEFMKANFPPILGKFFNDILKQVLKGAKKEDILSQIKVFKKQILGGDIPLPKLGNPTSVKKLNKYTGKKARAGEMFTEIIKGAPAPVRAAIRYNDLLRIWQLGGKHSYITQADKVKWIYLKDNPYKIDGLAYLEFDMPDKIKDFLEIYADRQKVFDSILLNKLEGFFSDLQWSLDLNPHLDLFSSFEI